MENCKIGHFAKSISGRDCGSIYLIYQVSDDYCYLVNGDNRLQTNPKKKNTKHIVILNEKSEKIAKKIIEKTKIFDAEIYSAIKKYIEGLNQEDN